MEIIHKTENIKPIKKKRYLKKMCVWLDWVSKQK